MTNFKGHAMNFHYGTDMCSWLYAVLLPVFW